MTLYARLEVLQQLVNEAITLDGMQGEYAKSTESRRRLQPTKISETPTHLLLLCTPQKWEFTEEYIYLRIERSTGRIVTAGDHPTTANILDADYGASVITPYGLYRNSSTRWQNDYYHNWLLRGKSKLFERIVRTH